MSEWHVTPVEIVNDWTDELLNLMIAKLVERKERTVEAVNKASGKQVTSDGSGLKKMGSMVEVIDNRDD